MVLPLGLATTRIVLGAPMVALTPAARECTIVHSRAARPAGARPVSVQLYTHSADSKRSSTPKTEMLHLPIDDANLMRRRLGVDLPWVCVGPTKIVCGRVRTGPNRDVIRPITRFSLTHDATQRWRQSAVVGGHDHSLYLPTNGGRRYISIIDQLRAFLRFRRRCLFDFFSRRVGKLPPTPHHYCRRRDTGKQCITDRPQLRKPREGYG